MALCQRPTSSGPLEKEHSRTKIYLKTFKKTDYSVTSIKKVGGYLAEISISGGRRVSKSEENVTISQQTLRGVY